MNDRFTITFDRIKMPAYVDARVYPKQAAGHAGDMRPLRMVTCTPQFGAAYGSGSLDHMVYPVSAEDRNEIIELP